MTYVAHHHSYLLFSLPVSMGYCILVAHGLGRLCSLLGRWGTAVLSLSMLLLLLLFSLKTVQQNHVWLSREALFRWVFVSLEGPLPLVGLFLKNVWFSFWFIFLVKKSVLKMNSHPRRLLNELAKKTQDMKRHNLFDFLTIFYSYITSKYLMHFSVVVVQHFIVVCRYPQALISHSLCLVLCKCFSLFDLFIEYAVKLNS